MLASFFHLPNPEEELEGAGAPTLDGVPAVVTRPEPAEVIDQSSSNFCSPPYKGGGEEDPIVV